MKISQVNVWHVQIPFNDTFSHASAVRSRGDSLVVEAVFESGVRGYGEGCPRSYVTGENSDQGGRFINTISPGVMAQVRDYESLCLWTESNSAQIDQNPAAWCALELAIIDGLAKNSAMPANKMFGQPDLKGEKYKYTAIVGNCSDDRLKSYLRAYNSFRFDDFKMKLTGKLEQDINRIQRFRVLTEGCRLRLDANNLWSDVQQCVDYLRQIPGDFFAIEEPLVARDFHNLEKLKCSIGKKIILDESFTTRSDYEYVRRHKDHYILNFRVSKMGGLIRSRAIIDRAVKDGIQFIIGAHVGETSILTRAAMLLGRETPYLVAREGAVGEFLLSEDLCSESIMFGLGGLCRPESPENGIGYTIKPELLKKQARLLPLEPLSRADGRGELAKPEGIR